MTPVVLKNCLILKNNELVLQNVVIKNGAISEITSKQVAEYRTIDCGKNFLMPGIIDCHVHFREPGLAHKEDWQTASMASAAGGITTVLDMPNTIPPTTTVDALTEKRKIASQKSLVNFGFHFGAAGQNDSEILMAQNIGSLKIFVGKSTGNLFVQSQEHLKKIFSLARQKNLIVCVHAEDQQIIERNERKFKSTNSAIVHSKIRDSLAEQEAISLVLSIQKSVGNKLHICHISSKDGLQVVREAKETHGNVSCEVAPQHLFLTEQGAKKLKNFIKVNPSIKSKKDQVALWKGIDDGTIDCIASDHAPHTIAEKKLPYFEAPSGMPGVETLAPLMIDACMRKKISLQKFVELSCNGPAKIFGIKNKGEIKNGFDADLALFDLEKTKKVQNKKLFTKCKWSAFDSMKLKGVLQKTIINGEIVFEQGKFNENFRGKEVF